MGEQILVPVSSYILKVMLDRAKVFDDGGDGADAESARCVTTMLTTILAQPASAPKPVCPTCGDNGVVSDGFETHSSGGIEYENGPIECVKDCPTCARPAPAGVVHLPNRSLIASLDAWHAGWNACLDAVEKLNGAPK